MTRPLETALKSARHLGLGPLLLYADYRVRLKTGGYRRSSPSYDWDDRPLSRWLASGISADEAIQSLFKGRQGGSPRFFFHPLDDLGPSLRKAMGSDGLQALQAEAEGVLEGQFRLFGGPVLELGFPPRWDAYPEGLTDGRALSVELARHWSSYREEAFPADVKLLWEPSRFGWAFLLGRAYRAAADNRYFLGFWELFESWRAANAPNAGPHWLSAQEVALRALALTFSLHAFGPALRAAPERAATLLQAIAVHANRIPPTLAYARAQGNNHLLTESAALYTIGVLFPELRAARRWRALGRRWLVDGLKRQIFPDGGYVQHSVNYHRLALQAALWSARLAEVNGDPLPEAILDDLQNSADCFAAFVDRDTGQAPNFGPNDGALILPLATCAYADHRPVLQLAASVLRRARELPRGPWDEACVWLGSLPESEVVEPLPGARREFPHAGLYLLGGPRSQGVLRSVRFTSRPGHSDQLNFDLIWNRRPVVMDAGSYLYSGQGPWNNGLAMARAHNGPVVDGAEPMLWAGRFLWLDWAHSRVLGRWFSEGGEIEVFSAAHDGYRRLGVETMRTVVQAGDADWVVIDELLGARRRQATLAWLLPDAPWRLEAETLRMETDGGLVSLTVHAPDVRLAVYRAGERLAGSSPSQEAPIWGWYSPTYAVREPAVTLVAEVEGRLPLRLVSWWALGRAEAGRRLEIEWGPPARGRPGVEAIAYRGDQLELG